MRLPFLIALGLAIGVSAGAALAADRPVVVELFTSQGCSSCPPANDYLNELAEGRTDVLPLAFHVTYWDRLGWKDPFSMPEATARQARYGNRFGDGSYTPEMVVDGSVGLVGSHRSAVGSAIEKAKGDTHTIADITLARSDGGVSIEVSSGSGSGRILLIGFDHNHVTAIGRGENIGRTLTEANVVRSVRAVRQWSGTNVAINVAFPVGEDAAVLLEAADGRIIGAARLPPSGST